MYTHCDDVASYVTSFPLPSLSLTASRVIPEHDVIIMSLSYVSVILCYVSQCQYLVCSRSSSLEALYVSRFCSPDKNCFAFICVANYSYTPDNYSTRRQSEIVTSFSQCKIELLWTTQCHFFLAYTPILAFFFWFNIART